MGGTLAGSCGGSVDARPDARCRPALAFPRLVPGAARRRLACGPPIGLTIVRLGADRLDAHGAIGARRSRGGARRGLRASGRGARAVGAVRILRASRAAERAAPVVGVGDARWSGKRSWRRVRCPSSGLGVPVPTPSWGAMVDEGRHVFPQAWWVSVFPGVAITLTVLGCNLLGDALHDVLDPRLHRRGGAMSTPRCSKCAICASSSRRRSAPVRAVDGVSFSDRAGETLALGRRIRLRQERHRVGAAAFAAARRADRRR